MDCAMGIERITSRKNPYILRLRALASDGKLRREQGEYLCDGQKLLDEAINAGAELRSILWREGKVGTVDASVPQFVAPEELFDYASPMKNSPGPVFTLTMPREADDTNIRRALVLENVQDPGNVGTVLRSAAAFGTDAVILCGDCADIYAPKTARASMGAIFRQRVLYRGIGELPALAKSLSLPLYAAALRPDARDIRDTALDRAIVAVGSEGRGLSAELMSLCDGCLIIPMSPQSESLNAAVAASVILWEMARQDRNIMKIR